MCELKYGEIGKREIDKDGYAEQWNLEIEDTENGSLVGLNRWYCGLLEGLGFDWGTINRY